MNKVFIAYSSKDKWIASKISDQLSAQGIGTFFSEKSLKTGDDFENKIREAFAEADVILFIISLSSLESEWMAQELGAAWILKKRIIPILSDVSYKDIPAHLTRFQAFSLDEIEILPDVIKKYSSTKEKDKGTKKEIHKPSIFISYSHKDDYWINRIRLHLKVLQHDGLIFDVWDDSRISPGSMWKSEIESALSNASIGLLVVSTDFLASDFVVTNELPELLLKAKTEGLTILPIIVRPCRFSKHKSLSKFQALNDPNEPLSALDDNNQEEMLVKLADTIEEHILFNEG